MNSNKLLLAATSLLLLIIQPSCRKEKLKTDPENLIVGNWQLHINCNGLTGCDGVADKVSMEISKKGLIKYKDGDVRIISIDEIPDPSSQSPQVSHLFEVKLKKRDIFQKSSELLRFKYIRHVNGYFDETGNFINTEMIHFSKKAIFDGTDDKFYIKK